jgi:hypothetical protein
MADLIFTSAKRDLANGTIDLDTDTLKLMLLTSSYTPSAAHDKRDDLTNEVTGTGYTAGGATLANKTVTVVGTTGVFDADDVTWPASTITARYGVVYKSRGGAASADELLFLFDFGSNITSTADTFTVPFSASGLLVIG